jgi:spartin
LKLHHRLLLSADLILSSLDSSMKQVVDVGGQNIGKAVEHK